MHVDPPTPYFIARLPPLLRGYLRTACWAAPASALVGLANDVWILTHVDDGNNDVGSVVGPRGEEHPVGKAVNERSSDRRVNKRGKQWRLTNQLGRVFEFVEELKPEQRSLLVVVVNSVQDVGMSVRRERGLRTSHREGRFETASSISRRTSDQGRAAEGFAR
jgi:hypothetical protein